MIVEVYDLCDKYSCNCIILLHHVMSICIEPSRWESHITIPESSWARLVGKLYDYSGVLLWIMSPLAGHDRTGTTLYVARGGVRCSIIPCWVWRQWTCICIAFGLFGVYLYRGFMLAWSGYEEYCFIYMSNIVFIYMRSIVLFICGYRLFIVYDAHYMFMEISLDKYSYH